MAGPCAPSGSDSSRLMKGVMPMPPAKKTSGCGEWRGSTKPPEGARSEGVADLQCAVQMARHAPLVRRAVGRMAALAAHGHAVAAPARHLGRARERIGARALRALVQMQWHLDVLTGSVIGQFAAVDRLEVDAQHAVGLGPQRADAKGPV